MSITPTSPGPRRNDLYFARLEPVVGSEQGGTRPVLIVSNNYANERSRTVITVPCTSNLDAARFPFNVKFPKSAITFDSSFTGESIIRDESVIITPQVRNISKSRLGNRIGHLNFGEIIDKVNRYLDHAFALSGCPDCGVPLRDDGLMCPQCHKVYAVKCPACKFIIRAGHRYCANCGREAFK